MRRILSEIISTPEFRQGIRIGLVALAIGILVGVAWRWRLRRPAPVAGLLFAVGALVALDRTGQLPANLALAIGALAAAGLVVEVTGWPPLFAIPLAGPGTWLLIERTGVPDPGIDWIRWLVPVVVVLACAAMIDFERATAELALGPAMAALTIVGLYGCMPDTESARALLGVMVPLALLGWPARLANLGGAGGCALVGLLAWSASVSGVPSSSSIVGALGSLALFVVLPIADRLRRARGPLAKARPQHIVVPVVAFAHATAASLTSRLAGLDRNPTTAAIECVIILALAGLYLVRSDTLRPRRVRTGSPPPPGR